MKRRAVVLAKVVHILTALAVFSKGLAKLAHPEGSWPVIAFLFAAGTYIVAITLLHERLHAHGKLLDASVYAIEAVVMAIVTFLYVNEGKQFLQYATGAAAVMFAVALVVRLVRPRR